MKKQGKGGATKINKLHVAMQDIPICASKIIWNNYSWICGDHS